MASEFARPSDPSDSVTEATVAISKNVTDKASLFVEYVGDYPQNSTSSQLLNSGGTYRLAPAQQVDFPIAFGLNRTAPTYIVGIGYSVRFDDVLAGRPR